MPRLADKGFTGRAPATAGAIPELPDFSPEFVASSPGAEETNAALQRWWDLTKQRVEFNYGDINERLRRFTRTIDGITGSIEILQSITNNGIEDYLESRYTINVSAGPVVTGMTIFSATGPDIDVSYVAFQADRFLVNTSSGGNKQIFSASSTAVKLGAVLTVDLLNAKMFIGTGTFNDSGTGFYVDSSGNFSLRNKLSFNAGTGALAIDGSGTFSGSITATSGTIGGWTLSSTTLSQNSAILDSAGQLVLGTSNDIVYLSATDSTYRIWIGNVTAGSASFRVTKTGIMTASNGVFTGTITSTSGTIAGFTLNSDGFSSGSGSSLVRIFTAATSGIVVGSGSSGSAWLMSFGSPTFTLTNGSSSTFLAATGASMTGSFDVGGYLAVGGGASNNIRATSGRLYFYVGGTTRWFISDTTGRLSDESNAGIQKSSSDGWTPKLIDGSASIEFQASGGQIYGRINGGSAILLG